MCEDHNLLLRGCFLSSGGAKASGYTMTLVPMAACGHTQVPWFTAGDVLSSLG